MDEQFLENLNAEDFFDEQINAMMEEMTSNTIIFIGIGVGTWICGWIQGTILMIVSTRITNRLRIKVTAAVVNFILPFESFYDRKKSTLGQFCVRM